MLRMYLRMHQPNVLFDARPSHDDPLSAQDTVVAKGDPVRVKRQRLLPATSERTLESYVLNETLNW